MKKSFRIVAILMALLLLALSVVACAENNDDTPADTTASAGADTNTSAVDDTTVATPDTTAQYSAEDALPADLNFAGETVRIISRDSDGVRDEIAVSDYSGEPINDAIYERNLDVEARLGIDIENTMLTGGNYVVTEEIRRLVLSGEDVYDMLANSTYSTIMYTSEGLFRDLGELEYLDLTQPYWSQGFNEVASFGTKQFMCAGALGLTLYRYMFVTMFNKDMIQARGLDNLYDVVNDGKWTLDYHATLSAQMYEDMNGNGEHDENDKYGFISGPVAYVDPYWSSCKLPILTKDNDNRYIYSFDNERMSAAVEKIIKLYHECEGSYIYASVSDVQDQLNLASHFADERSATATLRLVSVETKELRDMTAKYGIVPIPKLDEAQDGYRTFVHDQFTALAVPSTMKEDRLDLVGAYMEYAACQSYRNVIPVYYEMAIKDKYLNDTESAEMLDMIYENIYIDAGVLYTKSLDSIHQKLRDVVKSKSNNSASMFKTLSKIVEKRLVTLMDGLDKVS